jgi:predicted nucleotidyltransferase
MQSRIVERLASMRGVVAVVLGGSRAQGSERPDSDWDLGVYYRGEIDLSKLAELGTVYPPGSWGRIMTGGAWLSAENTKVDVLLRDLDVVEYWSARAREGVFDIDALLGYAAGAPTYSLLAERALAVPLHGEWAHDAEFPARLAERAPNPWRYNSQFSLDYANRLAARGDTVATVAQVAKAVIEQAHARLCGRASWVLNEKGIVERAGLDAAQGLFRAVPAPIAALPDWVARVRTSLTE